jgi:hypothetical protein
MTRALLAVPIGTTEANAFVLSYHRHNKPVVGAKFSIGASDGTRLVGVAIVGRPVARKLDDGATAEVTRVCVLDDAPKGTPSFLYSRCWRAWSAMGGARMVTYTLQSESGASLRGAGWRVVGQSPAWKEGKGWATRPGREWQAVIGQQKLRWETC